MATAYYLTTTSSDLDPGAESWSNALSTSAPGATTLTSTIANGDGMAGTVDSSDYAFTPSGDPGAGGVTGTYTLSVVVSTGDSNVTLIPRLARVNSSGTVQTGPTGSDGGGQALTAGTKTFTWTSLNLGTWASGDRLRVYYDYSNASTHGGSESIVQTISSSGTTISAPWTAAVTTNPTVLDASPTLGTHAAQVSNSASALDASPTLGTHAVQLQNSATVLDASPAYGTHAVQVQIAASALDASPTLGTHTASAGVTTNATILDASPTLGTHSVQIQNSSTVLDASPTLGTHAAQLQVASTALDASPTLGTHVHQLQNSASALSGTTYGTHTTSAGFTSSPTVLDASPSLGTHSAQLGISSVVLDASPSLGTHSGTLSIAASVFDAGPSFGMESQELLLAHSVLSGTVYGTHTKQVAGAGPGPGLRTMGLTGIGV